MTFPPKGTGIPLVDFALFAIFLWLSFPIFPFVRTSGDGTTTGRTTYGPFQNWFFFFVFVILAILFFIAWIVDLGAHL